jgi:hypothetical protein
VLHDTTCMGLGIEFEIPGLVHYLQIDENSNIFLDTPNPTLILFFRIHLLTLLSPPVMDGEIRKFSGH